jgi:hypothetical protein
MSSLQASQRGPLSGTVIVLELGPVSLKKKKELQAAAEKNGGIIDFVVSKKTTHVVTTPQLLDSSKIKSAVRHGCFVVTEEFITESARLGTRVDEWPYLFIGDERASMFGTSSEAYVIGNLIEGYTNVASIINEIAFRNPYSLLSTATTSGSSLHWPWRRSRSSSGSFAACCEFYVPTHFEYGHNSCGCTCICIYTCCTAIVPLCCVCSRGLFTSCPQSFWGR